MNFLKNETLFYYQEFYLNAWQLVIDNSYNLNSRLTEKEIMLKLVENTVMIQSCPVLFSLNFEEVFRKCCNLQKYEFAAILIQYMPGDVQKKYMQKLLCFKKDLLKDLNKLSDYSICGIYYVSLIFFTF